MRLPRFFNPITMKAIASGFLFAAFFLISVGSITLLTEPLPPSVHTPAFQTIQHGKNICLVTYIGRVLIITLTPEVIVVAAILSVLFGFNIFIMLRLHEESKPVRNYIPALAIGVILAMFSSSTCWLACCNGGIFLALFTNILPNTLLNTLTAYTGFTAIPSAVLLMANLMRIRNNKKD